MSIAAAEPVAAKVVGARAGAAGGSKAAVALPRDPGAHVAKLRGQGMDDQKIRKALRDMGYGGATVANVVPGNDAPTPPAPAPAPAAADASSSTPAAADTPSSAPAGPSGPSFGQRVSNRVPSGGGASGLLLGLVLYPVALAFLRDGNAGMKAWFMAKFLNKVSPATAGASGQPGTGSGGAGTGAGGGGGSSW